MNTGHYISYIINSEYYKNLTNASDLIDELVRDISNLKLALNDATGDIINEIASDLSKLEEELNSYKTMVKSIQNDLKANATLFDGAYNNWKNNICNVIDEGFYHPQYERKYSLVNASTGISKIVSVNDIPNVQKQETLSVWAYKYKTKLSKVYISDADNKIHYEYTDYFYGYTKKVMLINVLISCEDIFKEENRDTTKDYSKVISNGVVDFMNTLSNSSKSSFMSAPR